MTRRFSRLIPALTAFAAGVLLVACSQGNNAASPAVSAASGAEPAANVAGTDLPAKLVIGLDDNFPPMGFRDEKGELVGYDIDMAREAAKRMGIEAEFKPIDWSAKEAELKSNRVDALWNGMTITEERKKQVAFTKPYMVNHQIIIVTKDSAIQTKADLTGKVVGVQDGSSAVDAIHKDESLAKSIKELKNFGDNVTALMDLSTGRLEAVVVDEVVGRYYTSKKPGEYRILEENLAAEEYGVGVRQEDTALLAKLDETLDAMVADGTAKTIYAKWFEEQAAQN